jgi:hypothetical protein
MNRIYQGRITRIEAKNDGGNFESVNFALDQSTCPIWRHHSIFQDAVNYYLLAMASLAKEQIEGADKLMTDLPKRMAEAWEIFPRADAARAGARSLRESVAPWVGLDGTATIKQAYDAILEGNPATNATLSYALSLVLKECSGDSGIQQGGREYLPKLCDPDSKATFGYSADSLASGDGKGKLAAILHGEASDDDLRKIATEMDLTWAGIKVSPGEYYSGAEASKRLKEAIDHLEQMLSKPSERLSGFLSTVPDAASEIARMREGLKNLSEDYRIPRNRKAAKDLTFSAIAFMAFPTRVTAAFLKLGVKAPTKSATAKKQDGIDFATLGDDPVKLARGPRGYVFPAFTALPRWNPSKPGKAAWKEFDIAAFKEALKTLNQFRLKTEEREERKRYLQGLIAHLIGAPLEGWKPPKDESGEEGEIPDPLDSDLLNLAWELEEEMTRGLSESVVGELKHLPFGGQNIPLMEGGWTVTRASLRGLRDITAEWRRQISIHGEDVSTDTLAGVVKSYQGKEGKAVSIGSVGLFLTLCEPRFRRLWMVQDEEDGDEGNAENRFLQKFVDLHESVDEFLRCGEAINLTPAEPRHSRRLFMFSDMPGKSAPKYHGMDCLEVSLATGVHQAAEGRFRLRFAAPRLRRDGLLGGEEGWLQPMTRALGLKLPNREPQQFDSAVSLMPDFGGSGSLRYLLNFATDIDAEPIREGLGKANLWNRQFNGTKDKNIHLHWPGTTDLTKMKVTPWWDNPAVIERGFTVLSTDLGQRTAGAWALIRVTSAKPETTRPVRSIGYDGKREWFAEVLRTGMHRLPGEDALVRGKDGSVGQELSGKTGRMASEEEWNEALKIAEELLAEESKNWIGEDPTKKSHPEQNDSLIVLANRRLSRLGTFHRWSCFDPEKEADPVRRSKMIEKLTAELAHWEDEEVKGWSASLLAGDALAFRESAGKAFASYRSSLLPLLVRLANRVAPLREDCWVWKGRENGTPYGDLIRAPREQGDKPPIRGQRGLSMQRIEQMENLRRLFLRYNRSLDREAGKPAKFGRDDTGRASGEPCRDLLSKIDRIKEQRIDQTAHLILAQALGVKLAPHSLAPSNRRDGDHHGEYSRIPGRDPVDLVVIENLDRYLTSQGRAPSENSRLMKWAHRAVRDKVKMLIEEPFGIPVLEVPAAYSSRFSAVTGEPGSRCEERPSLDDYLEESLTRRSKTPPNSGQSDMRSWHEKLLGQFGRLAEINARRADAGKSPMTLLLPKTGGPLFVGAKASPVVQSDINAAINLGFRSVAAPDALHLLHRIRSERDGEEIRTAARNAREKSAFGKKGAVIRLRSEASAKLSKTCNFFHDDKGVAVFDRGEILLEGKTIPVASGIGLWHAVNAAILPRIVALNEDRFRRMTGSGFGDDPRDEIPM